jgi:6-phospho-beta-glucosidase
MSSIKLVVLGGSGVATPELAEAMVHCPGRTVPVEMVLVGRSRDKLEKVTQVSRLLAGDDPLLSISCTTDTEAALAGADFVLNQVRVGGLEARAFDESYPRELGLPGEETVGPGGFANACRTVPVVLEYARLIERLAPNAQLISFSNPASLVQYAVTRYTRVPTIGLCDAPITLAESIARVVGAPSDELSVDYLGMHHFGWVTGVWWRGRDLLPPALARVGEIVKDLEPAVAQAIGAIPCSYLKYLFHPDRMLAGQMGRRTRAEELIDLQSEILADYERTADGGRPTALARRGARWYGMIIAPVLTALIEGQHGATPAVPSRFIINVANGQTIPWLPATAVVEVPALVARGWVLPLATGPVPPDVKALLEANCAYEMLATEAIVERDRARALRALLLNPIRHTYDQAVAVLERAWGDPHPRPLSHHEGERCRSCG